MYDCTLANRYVCVDMCTKSISRVCFPKNFTKDFASWNHIQLCIMKFHHKNPELLGLKESQRKGGGEVNDLREREGERGREKVDISNLHIFGKNFEQNLVCWF